MQLTNSTQAHIQNLSAEFGDWQKRSGRGAYLHLAKMSPKKVSLSEHRNQLPFRKQNACKALFRNMTRSKKEHLKSWGTGAPLGPNQTGWKNNYARRSELRKWYWQGQYLSWLLMICKNGNSPVHLYSFSNRRNKMMASSHKLTHICSIVVKKTACCLSSPTWG